VVRAPTIEKSSPEARRLAFESYRCERDASRHGPLAILSNVLENERTTLAGAAISNPPRSLGDAIQSPHRLALGLTLLARDACWLELDEYLEVDLDEKRRLLSEHREQVFVELPTSRLAQGEVLQRVTRTLAETRPDRYVLEEGRLRRRGQEEPFARDQRAEPPLERAALYVQEDLCVMERRPEGWCLTAGCVCFPTRWDLPSKLGRSLDGIHERVPGYQEQLGRPTERFFESMKRGRIYRRSNWSLLDDPALFQPSDRLRSRPGRAIHGSEAGDGIWLRVERQALQRLPVSDAVLFSIRVHRMALAELARDAEAAHRLIGAIESMDPAMQAYKSLGAVREATFDYLAAKLAPKKA
jgi:hypothetical protein